MSPLWGFSNLMVIVQPLHLVPGALPSTVGLTIYCCPGRIGPEGSTLKEIGPPPAKTGDANTKPENISKEANVLKLNIIFMR